MDQEHMHYFQLAPPLQSFITSFIDWNQKPKRVSVFLSGDFYAWDISSGSFLDITVEKTNQSPSSPNL